MARADNPSARSVAEAAIWVARLRSGRQESRIQEEFRRWLAASDEHRAAFESVSDTWELAGGARLPPTRVALGRAQSWGVPALVAGVVLAVMLALWQIDRAPALATEVGERRVVALADGSTVTLNTDTRLRLRFSDDKRMVLLDHGEASFAVAKDSLRPFIVEAGDTKVIALGTNFDVRWIEGALAVTLAEGRVRVVEEGESGKRQEVDLKPGQRLEERNETAARLRAVDLENARAWQSGQVIFDETPLPEAVTEMNRYSDHKIELAGLGAGRIRISGAFKAGGSVEFAKAIHDLFGFDVTTTGDTISIRPGAAGA